MKPAVHAVAWVVLAVAAFVLWPERWGGSMSYVITSGTSMQPGFAQGDLAILRSSSDYGPGDVAAYHSTELEKIVMHRISEKSDRGYTFQGDNNDFPDPETVTEGQMLGKLVVRVPAVGALLTWFLKPVNLAIAAVALFLLLSDRRQQDSPSAPADAASAEPASPVLISALEVPAGTPRVDVVSPDELRKLAACCGRPLLEDAESHALYLHDGAVLFQYGAQTAGRAGGKNRRTARAAGTDSAPAADVPRPRRPRATATPDEPQRAVRSVSTPAP